MGSIKSDLLPTQDSLYKSKFILFLLCAIFFSLTGCAPNSAHQRFFFKEVPTNFPPTKNVYIWIYPKPSVIMDQYYDQLFGDYLVIGRSNFEGTFEDVDRTNLEGFSKSIGSDIVVIFPEFLETEENVVHSTRIPPKVKPGKSFASGMAAGLAASKPITTYSSTYKTNIYQQTGVFLRNVSNKKSLWDLTKNDFPPNKTQNSEFNGFWKSENYEIEVYESSDWLIGVVKNANANLPWREGEIKLKFDKTSFGGYYLMGNKRPTPASIGMSKFGYLEIEMYDGNKAVFEKR